MKRLTICLLQRNSVNIFQCELGKSNFSSNQMVLSETPIADAIACILLDKETDPDIWNAKLQDLYEAPARVYDQLMSLTTPDHGSALPMAWKWKG